MRGVLTPFFFGTNLLVWVKLGYPPNFNFPFWKKITWKEKEEERKKNNAKLSGHYVRQPTHNVRAHSLS